MAAIQTQSPRATTHAAEQTTTEGDPCSASTKSRRRRSERCLPPLILRASLPWRRWNTVSQPELLCYNGFLPSSSSLWMACVGEWLSLVEHLVRDQGVGGSNPLSPTILFSARYVLSTHLEIPAVGKNATVFSLLIPQCKVQCVLPAGFSGSLSLGGTIHKVILG